MLYKFIWHIFYIKNTFFIRYADQVKIGDKVLVKENTKMVPAIVMNVSTIKMQGNTYFFKKNSYFCSIYIFCQTPDNLWYFDYPR